MSIQFYNSKILFGDSVGANTDKIAFHEDCCCEENPCVKCATHPSSAYQAVIAGVDNQDCNECSIFNDTFALTEWYEEWPCIWQYTTEGVCGYEFFYVRLDLDIIDVQAVLYNSGTDWYRIRFGTSPAPGSVNCGSLSNYNLPYIGEDGEPDASDCAPDNPTCLISSVS
jgi:hypothetical protein